MDLEEVKSIYPELLRKYFSLTKEALVKARDSTSRIHIDGAREDFLDMITRYVSDAEYFEKNNDSVRAFAAINYAHGWLDAGARIGLFDVDDNRLFTVDGSDKLSRNASQTDKRDH